MWCRVQLPFLSRSLSAPWRHLQEEARGFQGNIWESHLGESGLKIPTQPPPSSCCMEINEDYSERTNGDFFWACDSWGVHVVTWAWQRQRQAKERASSMVKRRKASGVLWWEVVGLAGGGLTGRGASSVIGSGSTLSFLWLVLIWKRTEVRGADSCPSPAWPRWVTADVACLPGLVAAALWVRVLSSYTVWPLHFYAFSLFALRGTGRTNWTWPWVSNISLIRLNDTSWETVRRTRSHRQVGTLQLSLPHVSTCPPSNVLSSLGISLSHFILSVY